MRRIRLTAFIVLIALLIPAAIIAQDKTPALDDLLARVRAAVEERDYSCVISIFRPAKGYHSKEIYYELVHSSKGWLHIQPLTRTADGKLVATPVYFIRNGDGRFLVDPARKLAIKNPKAWGGVREVLEEGPMQRVKDRPFPKITSKTLGGGEAWLISSDERLSYQFYIDKATGFPLKFEIFGDSGVFFRFEVSDLVFFNASDVDLMQFEIPKGYTQPPRRHQFMGGHGDELDWLPLVPSSDDAPGGFILDSLRPHVIKGTLVYQTVFVHSSDTSDVVSVFQSAKPEFSKLVKQHFDNADVNIVVEERHDVILLIIGNYDDETLRKFAALFERNDERAINLLEADAEALNSLG